MNKLIIMCIAVIMIFNVQAGFTYNFNGVSWYLTIMTDARLGGTWIYVGAGNKSYLAVNQNTVGDITIPSEVKNEYNTQNYSLGIIDRYAFYNCNKITSVHIPSSVFLIRDYAFYGCSSITNINVDTNVRLGHQVFKGCTGLAVDDFVVISKILYDYIGKSSMVKIPSDVQVVDQSAFENITFLRKVEMPIGVECIGDKAFQGCENLEKLTFVNSVTNISSNAFLNCGSLCDLTLPRLLCETNLSTKLPYNYNIITNVNILDGVTHIAANCFKGCSALKRIVIPKSVLAIYDNAFKDCVSLEEIVFLGDAPDVGSDILFGTPRSLKITVKEGSVGWKGGVSTELPEAWPVGDAAARGISYYDNSADVAAMTPVITPADGSIFADTCEVSISCAMEGTKIYYRIDGKTPKFTDAYLYRGAFTVSDTCKIVAVAVKEGVENGIATATLTKRVLTLAEAAGESGLTFTTGGAADWVPIGDLTAADGVSARSGAVGDEEESWMELSVSGSGTLTFNWKVSCEDDPVSATWDHLAVFVDGKENQGTGPSEE